MVAAFLSRQLSDGLFRTLYTKKAGASGFEPEQADPKSAVLPLHNAPIFSGGLYCITCSYPLAMYFIRVQYPFRAPDHKRAYLFVR
jgi:hypothetical protein